MCRRQAQAAAGDTLLDTRMHTRRLLFIDNLRTLMIMLVIVLHLSVTYGGEGSWYYKEGRADFLTACLLTTHNAIVQSFFMGLLFLLAGYFTPASYDRKGPGRFLADRLLRLGIPMVLYDLVIHPFLCWVLAANVHGYQGTFLQAMAHYYRTFHQIGTGPLWFVEALLIFSAVYAAWRAATGRATAPSQTNAPWPHNARIALFALILGIVTFLVRLGLPAGWAFAPLNLQVPYFPQYIALFAIGIAAYRHNWLEHIGPATARLWRGLTLTLIFLAMPLLLVAGGAVKGNLTPYLGGLHWQSLAYALWEQAMGIAVSISLLALFRKRLNQQGAILRELSACSYTVYVLHAPVIVLAALAAGGITVYSLLKFALVAPAAVGLCFLLATAVRRLPLASRVL